MKLSPIHVASLLLLGMLSPVCRPQDKPKPEDKPKSEVSTTPVKVTGATEMGKAACGESGAGLHGREHRKHDVFGCGHEH